MVELLREVYKECVDSKLNKKEVTYDLWAKVGLVLIKSTEAQGK
jgi:hypothetical protein